MKRRSGFVSNSSTSSFTCDICGEAYTGWDACPSEFECSTCEFEHVMCDEHLLDAETPMVDGCQHKFDREANKFCPECGIGAKVEYDDEDYMSSAFCPICQFQTYSEYDMAKYLEKTRKISRDEVFAKIKEMNKRRKKLYNAEYITHVCEKFELTDKILLDEVKEKFGEYQKFYDFI